MKKTALLSAIFVIAACPLMAKPYPAYQHSHQAYRHSRQAHQAFHRAYPNSRHAYRDVSRAHEPANDPGARSHITCDMVRSYVAQVGLEQAKAMAVAAGMTSSEEHRARQCLAHRV
jgi:hypothetical protein